MKTRRIAGKNNQNAEAGINNQNVNNWPNEASRQKQSKCA
jgi:hypothetical protein